VRRLLAYALAAAFLLVAPTVASAAKNVVQCGPGNRWCITVLDKHGRIFFDIAGFDMKGSYRLCVTPPKAAERCKTFGLRANATGAHASSVRFTTNFPHRRKGRYRVRWIYDGRQVGRAITFSP
jgi:hypothetical protein